MGPPNSLLPIITRSNTSRGRAVRIVIVCRRVERWRVRVWGYFEFDAQPVGPEPLTVIVSTPRRQRAARTTTPPAGLAALAGADGLGMLALPCVTIAPRPAAWKLPRR